MGGAGGTLTRSRLSCAWLVPGAWEATRRPASSATWPPACCAGAQGGAQRPALPGPGCSSQLQYPPKRLVPNPSPPSPTSAQPGSRQAKTKPGRAAQLTQLPPRGECPSIGRLMKIKTHACARLPVLPIENALHISSPATFPHSTQRKSRSQLHLTVEETEVQGHALLNGEHPFPGSFQNKDSSCHLLSTGLTGNLTVIAGYQKKCMSYPGFSPAKLAR